MKKYFLLFIPISLCILLTSCILSWSPEKRYQTVNINDTLFFEIRVIESEYHINWFLDGIKVGTSGSTTYSYTPGPEDVGEHTLMVFEKSGYAGTMFAWWTIVVKESS